MRGARKKPTLFLLLAVLFVLIVLMVVRTQNDVSTSEFSDYYHTTSERHNSKPPLPFWTGIEVPVNQSEDDLVYFLHIPKSAGMTFNGIMRQMFVGNRPAGVRLDNNFAMNSQALIHTSNVTKFNNYTKKLHYATGHTDISVRDAVAPRRMPIITVLREPVSRVISMYCFVRSSLLRAFPRPPAFEIQQQARIEKEKRSQIEEKRREKAKNQSRTNPWGPVEDRKIEPLPDAPEPENAAYLKEMRERAREMAPKNITQAKDMVKGNMISAAFEGMSVYTSFDEYLAISVASTMNNYMTRVFSGTLKRSLYPEERSLEKFGWHPVADAVDDNHDKNDTVNGKVILSGKHNKLDAAKVLEEAKKAIHSVSLLGLVERWNDTLELLEWTFGQHVPKYKTKNVTPKVKQTDDVTNCKDIAESSRKKLTEIEWLDIELYNYAKDLFEKRYQHMKHEKASRSPPPPPSPPSPSLPSPSSQLPESPASPPPPSR